MVERRLEAISAKGDPLETIKKGVGGQRVPLGGDRGPPEGEGVSEPYPPARRTQPSAVRAPEVGQHDALEGARPCRACLRPAPELDGWQVRAHHRHRTGAFKIGMMNLGYNIRRLLQLERMAAAPA